MSKAKMVKSDSSSSDVFEAGNYKVTDPPITLKKSDPEKPPVDLLIVAPREKGTYPILIFFHGFMLSNTWYTTLFKHIASHGYILIAPQEDKKAVELVSEWLPTGLPLGLPENVTGDTDNVAVSGHSRGGKTAFALALGYTDDKKPPPSNPCKFKALIGIDPVAGFSRWIRPPPHILQYIPRCFDMSVPVAVIGTGYGNQWKGLIPPFAPDGVNHWEFYNESKPPACYFLAKEYGHVDMMDDNIFVNVIKAFCKSGKGSTMDCMRRGVGGIVVAFLRCYLDKVDQDLNAIVNDPTLAPILLEPVIYVKE